MGVSMTPPNPQKHVFWRSLNPIRPPLDLKKSPKWSKMTPKWSKMTPKGTPPGGGTPPHPGPPPEGGGTPPKSQKRPPRTQNLTPWPGQPPKTVLRNPLWKWPKSCTTKGGALVCHFLTPKWTKIPPPGGGYPPPPPKWSKWPPRGPKMIKMTPKWSKMTQNGTLRGYPPPRPYGPPRALHWTFNVLNGPSPIMIKMTQKVIKIDQNLLWFWY